MLFATQEKLILKRYDQGGLSRVYGLVAFKLMATVVLSKSGLFVYTVKLCVKAFNLMNSGKG